LEQCIELVKDQEHNKTPASSLTADIGRTMNQGIEKMETHCEALNEIFFQHFTT
jgi:hypothetical protein